MDPGYSPASPGGARAKLPPFWRGAIVAAVVVLICLLVWVVARQPSWGHLNYWKARLRETPDEILLRSSGDYDGEAQLALRRTRERLENPRITGMERVRDHHRVSRIIRFALLPFELFNATRGDVGARLRLLELRQELRAQQDEITARLNPAPRTPPEPDQDGAPGRDFIITDLLGQDAFLEALGVAGINRDPAPLVNLAQQSGRVRREAANELGETRGAQAAAFLDLSEHHTDDPENSHDPAVVAALGAIVKRLRDDPQTALAYPNTTIDSIAEEIKADGDTFSTDPRTGRPRELLVSRDALPVLERAKNGERMVGGGGITDQEVARLVWARAYHPENRGKREELRQAYFDALTDSWKKGVQEPRMVCVQGRISRLIGSLALLDYDKRNWGMSTLEELKNEIFEDAKRVMKEEAELIVADASAPIGQKAAAAQILAQSLAESKNYEQIYGVAEDADETAVNEKIVGVMLDGASETIRRVNARAPGSISERTEETIKNDLKMTL